MMTLFILCLAVLGLTFVAVPVVLFGLMLETCAERQMAGGAQSPSDDPGTLSARFQFAPATE